MAALFIEGIDLRTAYEGGPTQIDLSGVHFSVAAPSAPPFTLTPHFVVLVRCAEKETGSGVLETVFTLGDEQLARNVQPLQIEPGKFTYRLVRAELELQEYGQVEARCQVDNGHPTVVPYTVLPAPGAA